MVFDSNTPPRQQSFCIWRHSSWSIPHQIIVTPDDILVAGLDSGVLQQVVGSVGSPRVTLFNQVTPFPAPQLVSDTLEACRQSSSQVVVAIGGGSVSETTVILSQVILIFRTVDDETFLVLALRSDGNLGKARYLIRKQLPALRSLL